MPTPVDFVRGATFSFSFSLPTTVEAGLLAGWRLRSQLRKAQNSMCSGFIADLSAYWVDPTLAKQIVIYHGLTEKWPLGLAEMDVVLSDGSGLMLRTKKIVFNITRGITQ